MYDVTTLFRDSQILYIPVYISNIVAGHKIDIILLICSDVQDPDFFSN